MSRAIDEVAGIPQRPDLWVTDVPHTKSPIEPTKPNLP